MLHGGEALCWNPKLSHPCTILSTPGVQPLLPGTAFIQGCCSCFNCGGGLKRSRSLRCLTAHLHSCCPFCSFCSFQDVILSLWQQKRRQWSAQRNQEREKSVTRKCPDSLSPLGAIEHVSSSTHLSHHLLFLKTFLLFLFLFSKLWSQLWALL